MKVDADTTRNDLEATTQPKLPNLPVGTLGTSKYRVKKGILPLGGFHSGITEENQFQVIFTQAGLPTPPYKAPLGVFIDLIEAEKCRNSSVDLGNPTVWQASSKCQQFIPSTSNDLLVAKLSKNYQLDWLETSELAQIVSKTDLQCFCDAAFPKCKGPASCLNRLDKYKLCFWVTLFFSLVSILLYLLRKELLLISFILFVVGALGIWSVMQFKHKKQAEIHQKLTKFVHKNKETLMNIGVMPRPGARGLFIEFLPVD